MGIIQAGAVLVGRAGRGTICLVHNIARRDSMWSVEEEKEWSNTQTVRTFVDGQRMKTERKTVSGYQETYHDIQIESGRRVITDIKPHYKVSFKINKERI